jgi:AcrR family transcriptional regulator
VHLASPQPAHRRRGAALEEQLLAAAWEVLRDNGYAGFTLEAVAKQAGTSRPVIARRWTSRNDLVKATIAHAAATRPISMPDTGSLRGDLIACMREINGTRLDFATMLGVQLGGYYQETGETLSDLRDVVLNGQNPVVHKIFAAAVERGEADPGRLTPRIRVLPMDLLRNEILTTLQPMRDEDINEIVDTIVLPLVRPAETASDEPEARPPHEPRADDN